MDMRASVDGAPLFLLPAHFDEDQTIGLLDEKYLESKGCHAAAFDTLTPRDLTGLGGLTPNVDPIDSPAGANEWRSERIASPDKRQSIWAGEWVYRPKQAFSAPIYSLDSEACRVVDGPWKDECISVSETDQPGWVVSSMPPAGNLQGSFVAEFASRPLLTLHVQHNAGVESAWCRRSTSSAGLACLTYRSQQEYKGPWTALDLRSRSGR